GYCFFKSAPDKVISSDEMIDLWKGLCARWPIRSIEDGLAEDDWDGWQKLTKELGGRVQLVGDDLFVTNTARLRDGIRRGAPHTILVKGNQIGSRTERLAASEVAQRSRVTAVTHHPSEQADDR